jgi:SAM-dependent methyltransferase
MLVGMRDLVAKKCLVCSSICDVFHAVRAPWINLFSSSGRQSFSKYYRCNECEFSFFERYPEELIEKLYSGYRGTRYFQNRHAWEPWFGKSENDAFLENQSRQLAFRKKSVKDLFHDQGISLNDLNGCIDFGGDLGQYIPEEITGSKYVIDLSSSENDIRGGIRFVRDVSQISQKVDLVMCCMVLEHLNNPIEALMDIKTKLRHGGIFYVEVPTDNFAISSICKTSFYLNYLHFITKHRKLFILLDFFSGISRQLFSRIFFWGVNKSSEHINYFSFKSLKILLSQNGFEVIAGSRNSGVRQGRIRLGCLQVIAKKSYA